MGEAVQGPRGQQGPKGFPTQKGEVGPKGKRFVMSCKKPIKQILFICLFIYKYLINISNIYKL